MPPRYIALIVATVVVFGAGLYLFREVRATPATASVPATAPAAATPEQPAAAPAVMTATPSFKPKMGIPTPAPGSSSTPAIEAAQTRTFTMPTPATGTPDEIAANPNLELAMSEANKAYDARDYDQAKAVAQKVLARSPGNVRMLRILVTTACIDNDQPAAQKYYMMLPPPPDQNRAQMKLRCSRDFQVELKDS